MVEVDRWTGVAVAQVQEGPAPTPGPAAGGWESLVGLALLAVVVGLVRSLSPAASSPQGGARG